MFHQAIFLFLPLSSYPIVYVVLEIGLYADKSSQTIMLLEKRFIEGSEEEKKEGKGGEGLGVTTFYSGSDVHHQGTQMRHTGVTHIGCVQQLSWQQAQEGPCGLGVMSSLDSEADLNVNRVPLPYLYDFLAGHRASHFSLRCFNAVLV